MRLDQWLVITLIGIETKRVMLILLAFNIKESKSCFTNSLHSDVLQKVRSASQSQLLTLLVFWLFLLHQNRLNITTLYPIHESELYMIWGPPHAVGFKRDKKE
jgi:hypothetical protein